MHLSLFGKWICGGIYQGKHYRKTKEINLVSSLYYFLIFSFLTTNPSTNQYPNTAPKHAVMQVSCLMRHRGSRNTSRPLVQPQFAETALMSFVRWYAKLSLTSCIYLSEIYFRREFYSLLNFSPPLHSKCLFRCIIVRSRDFIMVD